MSASTPTDSSHSVTQLLARIKDDDSQAAEQIWRRYFQRLLPLARSRLNAHPRPLADAEDVLISVFDRFFRAAKEGRFARLNDREDLWQILLMLTERTAADERRRAHADKRGAGQVGAECELPTLDLARIKELADREPDPGIVAAFSDTLASALQRLNDGTSREVAILRMEGYQNEEIADRLAISLSSVERKLRVIRAVWNESFGS